jgi:hypothetical protein
MLGEYGGVVRVCLPVGYWGECVVPAAYTIVTLSKAQIAMLKNSFTNLCIKDVFMRNS